MAHNRNSAGVDVNSNPAIVSGITRPTVKMSHEGIDLDDLAIGAVLEIETGHTTYRLENRGEGKALLSGHPKYCPEPTIVQMQGSQGAAEDLKWRVLTEGLKMVFLPPGHGIVRTSPIQNIRRLKSESPN